MNFLRGIIIAASLLFASVAFAAPKAKTAPVDVKSATLAVYHGKQVCQYETVQTFFGPWPEWKCGFKSEFECTATVVGREYQSYTGLTAGHCFDWDKKNEYYISSEIGQTPVLKKIKLEKFENDDRYDFAIFTFESTKDYPVVLVDTTSTPKVGSIVSNVNFSLGLVKEETEGKILSEIISTPAIKQLADTKGRYLVGIGIGPGASGSAVLLDGKIVGLVEAEFPSTQMPTVVMPTGQTLLNFMEDDSAGIEPKPEPKKEDKPKLPQDEKSTFARFLHWLILWPY